MRTRGQIINPIPFAISAAISRISTTPMSSRWMIVRSLRSLAALTVGAWPCRTAARHDSSSRVGTIDRRPMRMNSVSLALKVHV